jgi:hypothetical protein
MDLIISSSSEWISACEVRLGKISIALFLLCIITSKLNKMETENERPRRGELSHHEARLLLGLMRELHGNDQVSGEDGLMDSFGPVFIVFARFQFMVITCSLLFGWPTENVVSIDMRVR